MFKKTTFALAGALGIVAAATLSTTAGAADTDAALVNNVTFFSLPDFNVMQGVSAPGEATAGCEKTPATTTPARSAQLIDGSNATISVKLFADENCNPAAFIVTLVGGGHFEDSGNPATGGTAALGAVGARSFQKV